MLPERGRQTGEPAGTGDEGLGRSAARKGACEGWLEADSIDQDEVHQDTSVMVRKPCSEIVSHWQL